MSNKKYLSTKKKVCMRLNVRDSMMFKWSFFYHFFDFFDFFSSFLSFSFLLLVKFSFSFVIVVLCLRFSVRCCYCNWFVSVFTVDSVAVFFVIICYCRVCIVFVGIFILLSQLLVDVNGGSFAQKWDFDDVVLLIVVGNY